MPGIGQTWQISPCGRGIDDLSRSPLPIFLLVSVYTSQNYHKYLCSIVGKEKIFLDPPPEIFTAGFFSIVAVHLKAYTSIFIKTVN